jgi:predicted component of type VI protein secretion system
VSIGASDECDLQIVAAGVEANELTVLYAGDTLLVRSERPEGPKLNGHYVTEEWQFLRDGDRLDLGTACIDVHVRSLALVDSGERKIEPPAEKAIIEPPMDEEPTDEPPSLEARSARKARLKQTRSFLQRDYREDLQRDFRDASTATRKLTLEALPSPRKQVVAASTPTRKLTVEPRPTRKLSIQPPPPPRNRANESTLRTREPSPPAVPQAVLEASRTLLEVRPPPAPRPRAPTERVEPPVDPEMLGCLFESAPTTIGPRKQGLYVVALG